MSKTFTHAGVSKLNGSFKVRFANDALRTKVLIKSGHTDIDLMELPSPMTKEEVVAFLVKIDFATRDGATNEAVKAAILAEADKRSEKPAKAPKSVAPSMEGIKAKVAAKKAKATPQVPALEGMTPLGIKPTAPKSTVTRAEVEAQLKDVEDAPF